MAQRVEFERSGTAKQPGAEVEVAVGAGFSPVVAPGDIEGASQVIIQNNSDTAIVLRPQDADDAEDGDPGFVLAPGGAWVDDRYLGHWCARHAGVAPKTLTLVAF